MKMANAVVRGFTRVGNNLFVLQLEPQAQPRFRAGQYIEVAFPRPGENWLNRHYSIASPPNAPLLQLYVSGGDDDVAEVWPKLGEPLWIAGEGLGLLSIDAINPERLPVMVSTGTGIAPFLSMLRSKPPARAVLLHGVRHRADLTFSEELSTLPGLRYIPVTSREPAPDGGISGHVQDALASLGLSPESSELLLCGNPQMIRDIAVRLAQFTLHYDRYW